MRSTVSVGEIYLCEECFAEFDSLVSLNQPGPGLVCPLCGSDLLSRQVERFLPPPPSPAAPENPLVRSACAPGGG
jgi:DNA-directed RNA polymerase subunit RPC12/RpoP